jgi:hypothetical protein
MREGHLWLVQTAGCHAFQRTCEASGRHRNTGTMGADPHWQIHVVSITLDNLL